MRLHESNVAKSRANQIHLGNLLQHHSSLSSQWYRVSPTLKQILIDELQEPCEKRCHRLWLSLRFNDDKLNQKYSLGSYGSHSHLLLDIGSSNDPGNAVEVRTSDAQSNAFPQRCHTPQHAVRTSAPMEQSAKVPEPVVERPDKSNPNSTNSTNVNSQSSESMSMTNDESHSLEYVVNHTNIYEKIGYLWVKKHNKPIESLTSPLFEKIVERYYKERVVTKLAKLRLLTQEESYQLRIIGPVAWAVQRVKAGSQMNIDSLNASLASTALTVTAQPSSLSQDSPFETIFLPPASWTQIQPELVCAFERETIPLATNSTLTRDPLGTSESWSYEPESTEPNIPTLPPINPFSETVSCMTESEEPVAAAVKAEPCRVQPNTMDSSGYEGHVEIVDLPNTSLIVIDDSSDPEEFSDYEPFAPVAPMVNARVAALLERPSATNELQAASIESLNAYLSCDSATADDTPMDGCSKRVVKQDRTSEKDPSRFDTFITLEQRKVRSYLKPALMAFHIATYNNDHHQQQQQQQPKALPMIFFTNANVQSVRYTNYPTVWPHCNEWQQNKLTVHLNPGCPGLFSVSVRDHHALPLFGFNPADRGEVALAAALAHVRKFRYGRMEPAREYYRLTVSEKVLQLFFDTMFLGWPHDGGWMMLVDTKSKHPADGDEVRFERFNYYLHSKRSATFDIADLLMPGIARKMRAWRTKLKSVP